MAEKDPTNSKYDWQGNFDPFDLFVEGGGWSNTRERVSKKFGRTSLPNGCEDNLFWFIIGIGAARKVFKKFRESIPTSQKLIFTTKPDDYSYVKLKKKGARIHRTR
ncbi:MAG: hypothetical protein AAB656_04095 [Patescibacteria group bacterium]|mgnify:CR=1 FL=1